jgi:hypothetical protein
MVTQVDNQKMKEVKGLIKKKGRKRRLFTQKTTAKWSEN